MGQTFFERSAEEWAKRSMGLFHAKAWHKSRPSITTNHLDEESPEGSQAVATFFELMQYRLFSEFCEEIQPAIDSTETPIEELMLLALTVVASNEGDVAFRIDGKDHGLTRVRRGRKTSVVIQPQAQVQNHRVDFLVEMADSRRDYSKPAGFITLSKSVAVECDGHAFHEKTKEQAARDKKRDREIQDERHSVMRFTGSEITRNAFQCADQVIRHLRWGLWSHRPSIIVSVETLRKELENFLKAHGGLEDTWIWDREELLRRKEEVWPGVELGIASEGPLYRILNNHYYGPDELDAYNDFVDLVSSLGWAHEEITHYKVFFYRDTEPEETSHEQQV